MSFTKEFKEKALSHVPQFEVKKSDRAFYFVKRSVGKAQYVYGEYKFSSRNITLDDKLELYAIVSDGNVYITNTYHFEREENGYPANVFTFCNKVKEVNDYISNELFTKYYDALPVRELTEDEKAEVKRNVRMTVLYDGGAVSDLKIEKVMKDEDVAKMLRGEITVEGYAIEYFDKHREGYIKTKSYKHELKKLADAQYNVADWEISLADAVRALDAKTVTVDFCYNGQLGTEKIEKPTLMRELYNNGDFCYWDFANSKKGKALLEEFGLGRHSGKLRCEHIQAVRYGKKVIYSKQAVLQKADVS